MNSLKNITSHEGRDVSHKCDNLWHRGHKTIKKIVNLCDVIYVWPLIKFKTTFNIKNPKYYLVVNIKI